jgi:DNA-binding NarL/FixJ family response regulator
MVVPLNYTVRCVKSIVYHPLFLLPPNVGVYNNFPRLYLAHCHGFAVPLLNLHMSKLEFTCHCLIVEDNTETRSWLATCVRSAFSASTIASAEDLKTARSLMAEQKFDLALVDLGLPDGSGLELIAELKRGQGDCHVIVATIYDDDKNLFTALRSGANGYILKDQDKDKIVGYLKGIQHDRPALSDASSQRLIDHFNNSGSDLADSGLTPREIDVTRLIAKGYSVDETAGLLELSSDTVKGYVKSIYTKLDVNNRSEVTIKAVKLGLIEP